MTAVSVLCIMVHVTVVVYMSFVPAGNMQEMPIHMSLLHVVAEDLKCTMDCARC